MKTYSPKASDKETKWYVVDADSQILGRLATTVANRLRGKDAPEYAPHFAPGHHVIVLNAEKIAVTGKKETDKMYYKHTGYPGGIRETNLGELRAKKPAQILEKAVSGMLPKNKLRAVFMKHLHVYAGGEHKYGAQKPEAISLPTKK